MTIARLVLLLATVATATGLAPFSAAQASDTMPPTLSAAAVNGATLTLTFNETLGAAASLANGAFTVRKTPQGGSEQNVSLSGTPAISGATVTLTLASAVLETDTGVKVSYARPTLGTGNRLKDEASNEVASFSGEAVTNVTGDTTPPTLERGEIDGGTVTLYFSEALDPNSVGGYFRVTVAFPGGATTYTAKGEVAVSVRNPVKVIARSTVNVIVDSTVSDHLTERSDAGVRL